jgi:hypothetical protein
MPERLDAEGDVASQLPEEVELLLGRGAQDGLSSRIR